MQHADQHPRARRPGRAGGGPGGWPGAFELGVGQRAALRNRSASGVGGARDLLLDEAVQQTSCGIGDGRLVPLDQHLAALGLGQQRQCERRLLRVGGDPFQQRPEVARPAAHRRLVEQVRVVLEYRRTSPLRSPVSRSVRSNFAVSGRSLQALAALSPRRARCQATGHSGARTSPERAASGSGRVRLQFLDQLLERHVLMGIGPQAVSRTRPSSSRKVGSPDRSVAGPAY